MVCLDSSFMIDLFKGRDEARNLMRSLEEGEEEIKVPSPAIMEVISSACLNVNPREKEDIINFLSDIYVLPLNEESAILSGEIEAELIMAGETIGDVDIMIGAVAKKNNEVLVTRNVKHFERIEGLKVEGY